ncbi:MAG: DEAD/DEAH box helicase [Micrococcaceae bacterium]
MTQEDLFSLFETNEPTKLTPAYPHRAAWGTSDKLRAWQQEALTKYFESEPRDFMAVATPGAGKTTFALRLARELIDRNTIDRIIIVVPTEPLKNQWAESAARVNLKIDPNFKNSDGAHGHQYIGIAVTYAQVANRPALHSAKTENAKTLVIFDEIHHAGDARSWGEAVLEAFDGAKRRLALTGTPFRSDDAVIPFVRYEKDSSGVARSRADYSYGYSQALEDKVVRPVIFHAYSGHTRWRNSVGDEMESYLGETATKDITAKAWRTALDPNGNWMKQVITAAHKRLLEVRKSVIDAAGLIIASNHDDARAYADLVRELTGVKPVLVLSDDAKAKDTIENFSGNDELWMVAVRMVSEGVDIPRLMVGVYATSISTSLFFAQAVGRYVRARRRGEVASIFLPSVPNLLVHANELEKERNHVLHPKSREEGLEDALIEAANKQESASDELTKEEFKALDSQAAFDKAIFDGGEFGTYTWSGSDEEMDFLGIPGLLEPEQVKELLHKHQKEQQKHLSKVVPASEHKKLKELRSELSKLVSAWSARSGTPHGVIHNKLREYSGGPAVPQATKEQIEKRITKIRGWFVGRK